MIKSPRYKVVSTFLGAGKGTFARPADFTNFRVALKHAAVHGDAAVILDRKLKTVRYNRTANIFVA
jgi:hypothetical protein